MDDFGIKIENENNLSSIMLDTNIKRLELHKWQKEASEFFFKHKKVLLEVSTGAGKTICAINIIHELLKNEPELKVLIVVPKNVILETGWFKELFNNGIKLSDIGIYYGEIKEYAKITITNMQSLNKVAIDIFDFIILDEVHHFATNRLMNIIQHPFKYMLGLSATIERMDDKHIELYKLFNYNIYKYAPKEAIQDGIINDFDFNNVAVKLDDNDKIEYDRITQEINLLLKIGGSFTRIMKSNSGIKLKMLKLMNERKQLVNNYYRKFELAKILCTKYNDKKIIIFNEYNSQTTKLYWHLLDNNIKSVIVHSNIDKEKRDENLRMFMNDKINVMLCTKVLDEGFNLPGISISIIMAGDSTHKQMIQRMGRVLRKKSERSILFQVYCKETIEEKNANKRNKMFLSLCSSSNMYIYEKGELQLIKI